MLNTKLFDHTILKADATEAQVAKICDEALAHDFDTVILSGLGKNTKVFELFDVEEIHYRPLIDGNRIWNLFILTNKHIGD